MGLIIRVWFKTGIISEMPGMRCANTPKKPLLVILKTMAKTIRKRNMIEIF